MNIEKSLLRLIENAKSHARLLNTLSYLENCGARKIAKGEHPLEVKEERLKHAAEEFRHAYHLKKQLRKLSVQIPEDYGDLLVPQESIRYLDRLDLSCCRYIRMKVAKEQIKEYAYLLVTYAIEVRASAFYPIYDELLKKLGSPVSVRSIVLEEKEHLEEMKKALAHYPNGMADAEAICAMESVLFKRWWAGIESSRAVFT